MGVGRESGGKFQGEVSARDVRYATLSSDGNIMLIQDRYGLQSWEWDHKAKQLEIKARINSEDKFQAAALSTTGDRVLFWHNDKVPHFWYSPYDSLFKLASLNTITYAVFSSNGEQALVWHSPDDARLWNLSEIKFTLESITQSSDTVSISANGERFLTESDKDSVQLQHMNKVSELESLAFLPVIGKLAGAVFSADGSRLLTWNSRNLVQLWDGEDGDPITEDPIALLDESGEPYNIRNAHFSDDGRRFRITTMNNKLVFEDGNDGSYKEVDETVPEEVVAKGAGRVLSWTPLGFKASLFDVAEGKEPIGLEYEGAEILGAAFSGDGGTLLIWGDNDELRLRDGKTGKEIGITLNNADILLTAALNHDGSQILTLTRNNRVSLWSGIDGLLLLPPLSFPDTSFSTSVSHRPSIPRVAFINGDKQILVFTSNTVYTRLIDEKHDVEGLTRTVELLTGIKVDENNKFKKLTPTELKILCASRQDGLKNPYSKEQAKHISIICGEYHYEGE